MEEKLFFTLNKNEIEYIQNTYAIKHAGLLFSSLGSSQDIKTDIEKCYNEIMNTVLNPDKMSHHLPSIYGLSLEEPIKALGPQGSKEKEMIILIDKDYTKIIDYKIIAEGDYVSVSTSAVEKKLMQSWLQEYQDQDIKAIFLHNHPDVIAVMPSESDRRSDSEWLMELFCTYRIRLVDSMIVGAFDCYSQRQYEIIQIDKGLPIEHNIFHLMDDDEFYDNLKKLPEFIRNIYELYEISRIELFPPERVHREDAELNELRKLYKKEESK